MKAARLAADIADVPLIILARTDANAAKLITNDHDENDRPFLTGERSPEGFYYVKSGIDQAISRGLAYAPYSDLIWCETATPNLEEAKKLSGLGPINEKIYKELKKRLSIIENLSIRYGIDKRMEEERYRRIKLNSASIKIGMTIPQVMDIIGNPFEIVHEHNIHGKDAQLWLYRVNDDKNLELSFFDYKLFKIE